MLKGHRFNPEIIFISHIFIFNFHRKCPGLISSGAPSAPRAGFQKYTDSNQESKIDDLLTSPPTETGIKSTFLRLRVERKGHSSASIGERSDARWRGFTRNGRDIG